MALPLPDKKLLDSMVWGFRPDFSDLDYLKSIHSPRLQERFGDADHPVPEGRSLDEIVRVLCQKDNICQPFVWAKFTGETSFLRRKVPTGKGYKAPLGYDCPDGGRDPRPAYYGVVPNIRGAIHRWVTLKQRTEVKTHKVEVNVSPEGQAGEIETITVRTDAEAAYLVYTPHLYSLHDFLAIYEQQFPDYAGQPAPRTPRLIAAKPAAGSAEGLAYQQVAARFNAAKGVMEAETSALAAWLGKEAMGLPKYLAVREALKALEVKAKFDTRHQKDPDPRIYVFTE